MKEDPDSYWDRDPDKAYHVIVENVLRDFNAGYLTRTQMVKIMSRANKLRDKHKRAQGK